jgi:hypothetical protein
VFAGGARGRNWTCRTSRARAALLLVLAGACSCGETPDTQVALDNDYPASSSLTVYRAFWQAVSFQEPVLPGTSSQPQGTVPASANTAYVILARNWDPDGGALPTQFVLLQSKEGFGVHLNDTLHIPVDDAHFSGGCNAESPPLTQEQADFIIDQVFTPTIFPDAAAPFRYDAATCTTVPTP